MKQKGYGEYEDVGKIYFSSYGRKMKLYPSKQMVIGYMLEYIADHHKFVFTKLDYIAGHSSIYEQLEEIIKELDGE
jgi:hypothetical protein